MSYTVKFRWVPESLIFPGYYAAREQGVELGTYNIHAAHQFETEEECDAWIKENSPPDWWSTEHGFYCKTNHESK